MESARRLDESEYTFNKQLGYISLRTQLQPDEVLAVAFEYNYEGQVYQVGEFSTDNANNTTESLYLKLLKGTTLAPNMPYWKLMMKNIYSLGAYSIQKEKFKLDILYQSDTTGVYVNYIPEGDIQNELLLRVMNLDRLNTNNDPYPDGFFDFIADYTIQTDNGRIIFPVTEPFGSHLRKKINNESLAEKYVYQELYDSTLTIARQIAEKNKFIFRGEFKASSGAEIDLGATNVARGSVRVTAGGAVLTENVDYTVDYTSGRVTIVNESIVASGTPISVSLENRSMFSMQRKTMLGLDLNYQINKDFTIGGTIMHLSEMPLTVKTTMGDESIKNTLWGLNTSFKKESQWLTNVFDKLPLLNLTQPSQIAFNAEFAHLIAGHYENKNTGGYSYLDDFESTQSGFNIQNPYAWNLASTPFDNGENGIGPLFPEAANANDISYGNNRALLAWYYIDGIFTRRNSSQVPGHIKEDALSNHYVRAVRVDELYPKRELGMNDASLLPVLNMAFYPKERGPYNLDADNINPDGTLGNPEKRWGGMMRKVDQSDFETANIEYIEFWMLDPFIYDPESKGGDLYFNLGDISEDILKDEKKFFENGLPIDGDLSKVDSTVWGYVPRMQSTVYAFDNTAGAREAQDVGLNGLSTEQEHGFYTYVEYMEKLRARLSGETIARMEQDPFSPLNDPAGDNYHYFRGEYYDRIEADILTRYKRYNGTEGNSQESTGRYNTSARTLPDVEDINQDYTLNKNEKYYEYKVSLRPQDLVVGSNFITDMREAEPQLANGNREKVKWYLFKIPIKKPTRTVGAIRDFKTIRFIRMYMTDFSEETVLRFGSLELVRGEWRTYEQDLSKPNTLPSENATIEVSSINIEENGDRKPVNYVLPPGITRMLDASQPQLRQENEQALSMKITNLSSQDARAIYKNTNYDLRQYKRIQLFTHAESTIDNETNLSQGELSVFLRLGSDYKNNYYEYEVPLALTPHNSNYNTNNLAHQQAVWPESNLLDFNLEVLTNLKLNRNKAKREGLDGVSYQTVYSEYDPDKTMNKISIVGNPSLAEVKTIMIGVRNNSGEVKSGEVWVNELRLTDFNEEGGWAANANLYIALSDLGTVNLSGRVETTGFGALDQSLNERRMDDYAQYNIAANVQLGKFFPEKAKVNIPLYYTYSKATNDPKYNPLDQDILLDDALDAVDTKAEKDSIRNFSRSQTTTKSITLNNVKVDIRSKNPMPYDPANFSFGYSYREDNTKNPETEYETTKDYRGNFAYNYTPYAKPLRPFAKVKAENGYTRYIKQLTLNYLPSNISFQSAMARNYYEIQLRDLTNSTGENNIPVSFSQNFIWDRAFRLSWNFTNNLSATFNSGTNARIEEPYVQVNKELNKNDYEMWKDSVNRSIRDLGKPMKYDQSLAVTWNLPLQSIPILDWISSSATYNATYNWDRGATTKNTDMEIGNTIRNQRIINTNANFNFQGLYNKSNFLRQVNQKFTPGRIASRQEAAKRPQAKLEMEVKLSPDSGTVVRHQLFTNKVRITARDANGKVYPIKYKALNMGQVLIQTQDTATLSLTMVPGAKPLEGALLNIAEYSARFLMMLRRINVQYSTTDGMMLPGFRPEIGDMFGQKNTNGILTPGLGFAFGSVNKDYIYDAIDKDWLVMNQSNVTPAMINRSKNLTIRANLEPITGLRIELNANRVDTRDTEIQYMYEGMPEIHGGRFLMTTSMIKTAFKSSGDLSDGYHSSTFETFLENRQIIADRLQGRYDALSGESGQQYPVSVNSADVLIPAFLAAYTGKDAAKIKTTAFPSLSSLLPNWRITYDGLINVPFVKKHFKSFVLTHQYSSNYNVGSYSSYRDWTELGNGLGYTKNVQDESLVASSQYNISSVSMTENFNPLLGADATLLNNITANARYNKSRTLNLNMASYQIVEASSNEFVVGLGYKVTQFNKVLGMRASQEFSNDLTVKIDFSYNKMQSLIRKIEANLTQATSGNVRKTIQFSADYALSRSLSLRAYYDLQINEPLISNASFPTSNSNYGVSVRFSLTQ
ncbi:cell surface protein SprA [Parabacteroides sp. OttesenSCG-928-G07]|nr:cell surface protein SprA [Parabacteroides sp. OttesenSCG-928-G07]